MAERNYEFSDYVRRRGFSVNELADISGFSSSTLSKKYFNKRTQFDCILEGAVAIRGKKEREAERILREQGLR